MGVSAAPTRVPSLAGAAAARHVLGARAPPPLVLAAVLDRDHAGALADVEAGDALRAVDLMARERQRVHPEGVAVERDLAKGLHGADVGRNPLLARAPPRRGDRAEGPP